MIFNKIQKFISTQRGKIRGVRVQTKNIYKQIIRENPPNPCIPRSNNINLRESVQSAFSAFHQKHEEV
jgi:hypothetical protein